MKQIYIVEKNADFTEGRGPMLFDSAWENGEDAIKYVSKQSGIYGSPQKVERNKYDYYAYANGYLIREVSVLESLQEKEELDNGETKRKALSKLTEQEKIALGLK